jgi:transglutaminase-like putative cysteine protease
MHRDTGAPQSPAHTLQSRSGACRDLAVLFVDCCRAEGVAARFASGYQKGNLQSERRHLHAWPEVYLPGAGWRGFDPALGLLADDTYIRVAVGRDATDVRSLRQTSKGSGDAPEITESLSVTRPDEEPAEVPDQVLGVPG